MKGATNDDYKGLNEDLAEGGNVYTVTGAHPSIISARVSYVYNLVGPAITLDTACSSALVAIDLGSKAILSGNLRATEPLQHVAQTPKTFHSSLFLIIRVNQPLGNLCWCYLEACLFA